VDPQAPVRSFHFEVPFDFRHRPKGQVLVHQRAQPADDDERHDDALPDPVSAHHAAGQPVRQGGEPGVAERGNGVENRDDLLEIPAYEPERLGDTFIDQTIAPLEELVDILYNNPQVTAFVELKAESIVHCGRDLMIAQVQRILSSVAEQTVLMSFDYELANIAQKSGWPLIGVVLERWSDLTSLAIKTADPDYIFADHQIMPEDDTMRHSPLLQDAILVAYEVGNKALACSLLDRSVDMLETYQLENLLTET